MSDTADMTLRDFADKKLEELAGIDGEIAELQKRRKIVLKQAQLLERNAAEYEALAAGGSKPGHRKWTAEQRAVASVRTRKQYEKKRLDLASTEFVKHMGGAEKLEELRIVDIATAFLRWHGTESHVDEIADQTGLYSVSIDATLAAEIRAGKAPHLKKTGPRTYQWAGPIDINQAREAKRANGS